MRAMEGRHILSHDEPNTGASALFDNASAGFEYALNIPPGNRRANRISEDRHKGLALAVIHERMVLLFGYKSSYGTGLQPGSANSRMRGLPGISASRTLCEVKTVAQLFQIIY
jgi:hypothetical protein